MCCKFIMLEKQADKRAVLQMVYLQTNEMKVSRTEHADVIFIDCTFRVNIEDYSLNTLSVLDENGFGQLVSVSLMMDDKLGTERNFIRLFELYNPHYVNTKKFFVDKDFSQLDVLSEVFPVVPRMHLCLLCCTNDENHFTVEHVEVSENQNLLTHFPRIMCYTTVYKYFAHEKVFKKICFAFLRACHQHNWGNMPEMWVFAFRLRLRTFGNQTTSHVERFFFHLKSFSAFIRSKYIQEIPSNGMFVGFSSCVRTQSSNVMLCGIFKSI